MAKSIRLLSPGVEVFLHEKKRRLGREVVSGGVGGIYEEAAIEEEERQGVEASREDRLAKRIH